MATLVEDGKQNKTLSKEQTAVLFNLIDVSAEKDRGYFNFHVMMRNLLKGDHWKDLKPGARAKEKTKMVVNLAHAHVRTMLPTLFFQNPTINALPTLPQHEAKAQLWTTLGNNTISKIGFKDELKEIVLDSIVYPEGVFKWVVNKVEREDQDNQTEEDRRGPTEWLSQGSPAPVRLSPVQLVVDYLAPGRRLEHARFISIRYMKTLDEIKAHKVYGKHLDKGFVPQEQGLKIGTDRNRRDPFTSMNEGEGGSKTADVDDMVKIHEVWIHELVHEDKKIKLRRQMCVLLEGHETPIRPLTPWEDVLGKGVDKYPVHRLVMNPVPDDMPTAELGIQHSLQTGINWLTSRILGIVEQEKTIREWDSSKVKNAAKTRKQLRSGNMIEDIEVTEPGAFSIVQPTFAGRDNYQMLNVLNQYLQQVGGFGANRRGGTGARTATEASIIETGTQIKTDEKVDTVRTFQQRIIEQMYRIIMSLVAEDPEQKFVFRTAGEAGQIQWNRFTSEDIAWMPDIEIEVDSFRQRDQQQEMQKVLQAFALAMQARAAGENVRLDVLLRQSFEIMGIKDIDKALFSAQDEMLQQTMELVLLSLGQQAEVKPDDNHPIHIQVIDAFRNSKVFQALNPEVIDAIEQHAALHEQALMQQQEAVNGPGLGQGTNPFEDAQNGVTVPTEANLARQATAQDRLSLAQPGAGGQQETT